MFIFHLFQFCKRINRMFNMSLNQLNYSRNLLHVFILFIISSNMPPKCDGQFPLQNFCIFYEMNLCNGNVISLLYTHFLK